jgi:small-conductance mechanosensitive channel
MRYIEVARNNLHLEISMAEMSTIRDYLSWVSSNVVIQALLIVILSLIAAKIADLSIARVLKQAVRRTRTELDDRIIALLHRPIFLSVAFIGLLISLQILAPEVISEGTRSKSGAAIVTLIALTWTVFLVRLTTLLVNWMSQDERRFQVVQAATAPLFDIGAKVIFIALFLYLVLSAWNINVTGLLTSAGILGLALGLAAKDTLSNLFAGVSILADAPYKIGDFIILDNAERGKVTKVGLRSTRILTRDLIEITIPNSIIAQNKIINESGGPSTRQRIRLPVNVAYGTDANQVTEILTEVAGESTLLSKSHETRVQFKGFGPSELEFELRCWIDQPVLRGRAIHDLNTSIYKALNDSGIEIPYPKRDLYIKEIPKGVHISAKDE